MDKNTGMAKMITGQTGLPASSTGGITSSMNEDGSISISFPDTYTAQCGRIVNDFFGKAIWMGKTFDVKMARTDATIAYPEAGMAFVIPLSGKYKENGHTGIITKVNDDGTVQTLEGNLNDDEKVVENTRNIKDILNGGGFGRNPNPTVEEEEREVLNLTPAEKKNASAAGITLPESGDFNDLSTLDKTFVRNDIKSKAGLADVLQDVGFHFVDNFEGELEDFTFLKDFLDSRNIPKSMVLSMFDSLDFSRSKDQAEAGELGEVLDRGTIQIFTSGNVK